MTLQEYLDLLIQPLVPKTIDKCINKYFGTFNIFPELNVNNILNAASICSIEDNNTRVGVHYLDRHKSKRSHEFYQDRTIFLLAMMYLDTIPFLLIRNTIREEDTYPKLIIINQRTYREALFYIFNLMKPDMEPMDRLPNGEPYNVKQSGGTIPYPNNTMTPYYLIGGLDEQYINKAINNVLTNEPY